MDSESRKRNRNVLNIDLALIDELTGKPLGKLVNIHEEGMMIITQADVQEDNIYQVTLMSQQAETHFDQISLGLDCVWLRELEQGNGCWAGFRIISASDQALQEIESLIRLFSSEEVSASKPL